MKPIAIASSADKINRFHQQVVRLTGDSKKNLHGALLAAWQAGKLLLIEQEKVRRTMGAAWGQWLGQKFQGSPRTAQNYMRLAEDTPDVSVFDGLSLRQVYLRLGIATEPKGRTESARVASLPPYVRLANRLLVALSAKQERSPDQRTAFRQDLRALYERLRRLFEADGAPQASLPSAMNKRSP